MSEKEDNNGAEKKPQNGAAPENAADDAGAPAPGGGAAADDAAGDEAAAGGAADENDDLRDLKDKYMRVLAEMENTRRRAEKQVAEAHQFALAGFGAALSEVRDCLEKALDGGGEMREGVALTLRKLADTMEKNHILPIRPDIGVSFDPAMHMAIGTVAATKDAPDGTVAVVVQAGCMVSGRVVRAADVMVGKAAKDGGGESAAEDNTENQN